MSCLFYYNLSFLNDELDSRLGHVQHGRLTSSKGSAKRELRTVDDRLTISLANVKVEG